MAVSSLFSHALPPQNITTYANYAGTYALGVVIRPDVSGEFTSIWYYVGTVGLGAIAAKAHIYRYVVLNTVPDGEEPFITEEFTLRNTVGWQEITLSSPVAATSGTRYVISISFPFSNAYWSEQPGVFAQDLVSGDLTAESQVAVGNGRYSDLNSDTVRRQYPMRNWADESYCVDVSFQSAAPATTHFRVADDSQLSPMSVTSIT